VLHHVMDAAIGDRDVRPQAICLGIAGSIALTIQPRSRASCAASGSRPK
jgi:hypothetical protein